MSYHSEIEVLRNSIINLEINVNQLDANLAKLSNLCEKEIEKLRNKNYLFNDLYERLLKLEEHKCKQAEENHAIVNFREALHRRLETLEEFINNEVSR